MRCDDKLLTNCARRSAPMSNSIIFSENTSKNDIQEGIALTKL